MRYGNRYWCRWYSCNTGNWQVFSCAAAGDLEDFARQCAQQRSSSLKSWGFFNTVGDQPASFNLLHDGSFSCKQLLIGRDQLLSYKVLGKTLCGNPDLKLPKPISTREELLSEWEMLNMLFICPGINDKAKYQGLAASKDGKFLAPGKVNPQALQITAEVQEHSFPGIDGSIWLVNTICKLRSAHKIRQTLWCLLFLPTQQPERPPSQMSCCASIWDKQTACRQNEQGGCAESSQEEETRSGQCHQERGMSPYRVQFLAKNMDDIYIWFCTCIELVFMFKFKAPLQLDIQTLHPAC